MSTVQAKQISADTDVDVKTYITASGSFQFASSSYDAASLENLILGVRYQEISLAEDFPEASIQAFGEEFHQEPVLKNQRLIAFPAYPHEARRTLQQ